MATRAAATAAKAIYAEPAFIPKGPINSGRFNLIREIAIGFTIGLTGGMMWKVRGALRAALVVGQFLGGTHGVLPRSRHCRHPRVAVVAALLRPPLHGGHCVCTRPQPAAVSAAVAFIADVALGGQAQAGAVLFRAVC